MTPNTFNTLELPKALLENLTSLQFSTMTPIQQHALPAILKGKDVIAKAKTGSGKTLAFGIGASVKITEHLNLPQILIMTPTRELADQVATVLRQILRHRPNTTVLTLCGGTPLRPQADALKKSVEVIVGTPGRIKDHLAKETLDISQVHTLILDEADRMLDMGFIDAIEGVINNIRAKKQTLLFSATFAPEIKKLSQRVQCNPLFIEVASERKNRINEIFIKTEETHRSDTLKKAITAYHHHSTLIFCNTKESVKSLQTKLRNIGDVLALHGDLDQRERDETLLQFANGSATILVATDVAARGLDIDDIGTVINYDLPPQLETYIHRIGRTGRVEKEGTALSLFSGREQKFIDAYNEEITPIELKKANNRFYAEAKYSTIALLGGKKSKIRKGDILGALIKEGKLNGNAIGKIEIKEKFAYIAITRDELQNALHFFQTKKVKNRKIKAWEL
jgi:ATP-dependent RNA helicase DbpA